MRRSSLKTVLGCASLLLAAASPSLALSLSVLPAHPVEGTPFSLVIGVVAGCLDVDGVLVTPGNPSLVTVTLGCIFLTPPRPTQPILLEVPIGPLTDGTWLLRVLFPGGQETLQVEVQALPFSLDFASPSPQAGSPFTLRLTGSGTCPNLDPAQQDGNLLSLRYLGDCWIESPPPAPFVIEQTLGPLPAGDYVVQVVDQFGDPLVSRRLHVFGSIECIPSETALCLQNGRFRVEATWRTVEGQGVARVHPETADSGALWFFGPDNLELLVKVLNACQHPSHAFWVFSAGLTNVEVELVVTDMVTKVTRRYRNPLNRPFVPIQDTGAFSC